MRPVYHITSQKYHNQDSSNLTVWWWDCTLKFFQTPTKNDIQYVKQKRWTDWGLNPGPSRNIPDALTTELVMLIYPIWVRVTIFFWGPTRPPLLSYTIFTSFYLFHCFWSFRLHDVLASILHSTFWQTIVTMVHSATIVTSDVLHLFCISHPVHFVSCLSCVLYSDSMFFLCYLFYLYHFTICSLLLAFSPCLEQVIISSLVNLWVILLLLCTTLFSILLWAH